MPGANQLALNKKDAHLLLDFRELKAENVDNTARTVFTIINQLKNIMEWKTLTVAASGYPESLSGIPTDSVTTLQRTEFDLWNRMITNSNQLKRIPSFGDYGVVHPTPIKIDPLTMNSSAKIRYTVRNNWLILKGHSLKKPPKYQQYPKLARDLVLRREYMRRTFSWGDDWVYKCVNSIVGTGNLTSWVTNDTNHHLTYVSSQIANAALP